MPLVLSFSRPHMGFSPGLVRATDFDLHPILIPFQTAVCWARCSRSWPRVTPRLEWEWVYAILWQVGIPKYHPSCRLNASSAFGGLIGNWLSRWVCLILIHFWQVILLLVHSSRRPIRGGNRLYLPDLSLAWAPYAFSVLVSLWQGKKAQASCRIYQRI